MKKPLKFMLMVSTITVLLFWLASPTALPEYRPSLNYGSLGASFLAIVGMTLFGWALIKASIALRPKEETDICHTCNQEFDNGYTLHCGQSSARICAECWSQMPDKHLLRKEET